MNPEHLDLLISRYLDGSLTPGELADLERELTGAPEAARRFVALARLESSIHRHFHRESFRREWLAALTRVEETLPADIPRQSSWARLQYAWTRFGDRASNRHWWAPAGAIALHALLLIGIIRWASVPVTAPRETTEPIEVAYEGEKQPPRTFDELGPMPAVASNEKGLPPPTAPSPTFAIGGTEAMDDPFADLFPAGGNRANIAAAESVFKRQPGASARRRAEAKPACVQERMESIAMAWGALANRADQSCARGMRWLAAAQKADGSWPSEPGREVRTGALALLAFHGRGESARSPAHGATITAGLRWLLEQQQSDGWFGSSGARDAASHGLALAAVSEAYAFTRIPSLLAARDRAIKATLEAQTGSGLWHDAEGETSSLYATLAQLMALRAIRDSISPDPACATAADRAVSGILLLREDVIGAHFAYGQDADGGSFQTATRESTRAAAWALQLSGGNMPPEVLRTVRATLSGRFSPQGNDAASEWMIAAHVACNLGGTDWVHWRDRHLPRLLKMQQPDGCFTFDFAAPPRATESTACAILALSVHPASLPVTAFSQTASPFMGPSLAALPRRPRFRSPA